MNHQAKRMVKGIIASLLLAVLIAVMAFPFFYMLTSSVKRDTDIFTKSVFYIPTEPNWHNYVRVMTEIQFPLFFLNTFKVTILAVTLQFIVSALAAYAFAKMRFPGRNFIFGLFISTMMVPWTAIMIPQFALITKMGLYDTHTALIILQAFSAFGIFLLRQFFLSVPNELSEAAIIDGCGHFRILISIVLPLSKSAISALVIFSFIKVWNDYLAPLIYLRSTSIWTLQLGLSLFRSQYSMEYSLVLAGTTCSLLPILLLYIFCEKQITQGIAFSGMKN